MPHYRFHVLNDMDAPDEEGLDLPTLAHARLTAVDYARELAAHAVRQGRLNLEHRIDVEDEAGELLFKVTFADAIEIAR